MSYVLHYAPDNASMIVRMALEHQCIPYATALVDRASQAQRRPAYLRLNPHGLIPVMETPDGAIFETGAILLWLADRHGGLGAAPDAPARAGFLKWLFWLSNALHASACRLFHPERFPDGCFQPTFDMHVSNIKDMLDRVETELGTDTSAFSAAAPGVSDFYLACLLRWFGLYPAGQSGWFDLAVWPRLQAFARDMEDQPAARKVATLEGLGQTIFSAPSPANPPEGSAN